MGYAPLGKQYSPRVAASLKLSAIIAVVTLFVFFLPSSSPSKYDPYHHRQTPIPAKVHYVYIKQKSDSTIHFPFAYFLTVYASVMYIKPSKIYIHSDYTAAEVAEAGVKGSTWTRKLINMFPGIVEWNHIRVPEFAGPNESTHIDAIQHKSDFIRWEQIVEEGGIYLDWDVVPLRPLTPLMNAGFSFIAGRQYGGKDEGGKINGTINNGAFMTSPRSTMARIMLREQTAGFTGAWEYNLQFLTAVAERLVAIPGEVLILDRHAFAPTHWFPESTELLFRPFEGPPSPEPYQVNGSDPLDLYDLMVQNRRNRREWEMDLSATYLLHAFQMGAYLQFISPKGVLDRQNNYGIAVWPTVRRMVEDGAITGEEDEW